ncbi:MAG: primase C-terminal domain-containing protein [Gemmatimonadota bacterium]|nr:primase C-terminal domain-containing protein [Gemmatimonadota bacterium]
MKNLETFSENRKTDAGALRALYALGGHLVLCVVKRPLWWKWHKLRPAIEVVLAHGDNIGIVPFSVGTSALDIDFGEIGELVEATDPLVVNPSPRGHHAYYRDGTPRPNRKWAAYGCGGEVRSGRGFLVLYPGGAERLVGALATRPRDENPFPVDLFEAAGLAARYQPVPLRPREAMAIPIPSNLPELETVAPGGRNNAVFDHVRFIAYREDKGTVWEGWFARVLRHALAANERLPIPLDEAEAFTIARNVATWTWSGGGPIDHGPPAQVRRGRKSGKVRRGVAPGRTVHKPEIAARDAAICAAVAHGMPYSRVAERHGIGIATVHDIVTRDAPLFLRSRTKAMRNDAIRRAHAIGYSMRAIAREHGVSVGTVHQVVRGVQVFR